MVGTAGIIRTLRPRRKTEEEVRVTGSLQKVPNLIARTWRGWTTPEKADAYERLLKEKVLPGLKEIEGYHGGYVLRQDGKDEAEFVVVNFFKSLDAVRAFAGSDYTVPVFDSEARQLLAKVEPIARHYDVRLNSVEATRPSSANHL